MAWNYDTKVGVLRISVNVCSKSADFDQSWPGIGQLLPMSSWFSEAFPRRDQPSVDQPKVKVSGADCSWPVCTPQEPWLIRDHLKAQCRLRRCSWEFPTEEQKQRSTRQFGRNPLPMAACAERSPNLFSMDVAEQLPSIEKCNLCLSVVLRAQVDISALCLVR